MFLKHSFQFDGCNENRYIQSNSASAPTVARTTNNVSWLTVFTLHHLSHWREREQGRQLDLLEQLASEKKWELGLQRSFGVADSIYSSLKPGALLWKSGANGFVEYQI